LRSLRLFLSKYGIMPNAPKNKSSVNSLLFSVLTSVIEKNTAKELFLFLISRKVKAKH